jgi:hypothetical protein
MWIEKEIFIYGLGIRLIKLLKGLETFILYIEVNSLQKKIYNSQSSRQQV